MLEIEGKVTARSSTGLAILFESVWTNKKAWLPLSQIELPDDGSEDTILCPDWLAKEKELV
jgi:hypothetical protein